MVTKTAIKIFFSLGRITFQKFTPFGPVNWPNIEKVAPFFFFHLSRHRCSYKIFEGEQTERYYCIFHKNERLQSYNHQFNVILTEKNKIKTCLKFHGDSKV